MFESIREPLQERWISLSKRDQQAAIALTVATLLAIVIFGVISPMMSATENSQRELNNAQNVYNELKSLAPNALSATGGAQSFDANAINSEVRRQAARYGVVIQRFEPSGSDLKVWVEDARYPNVIQWLGGLESIGVTHSELALDNRPQPGFVNVRVTFTVGN